MRRYEVVFILAPTLSDEEVDQSIEGFEQTAQEMGAKIVNVDKWGKRRLAFPVKNHSEGFYVVLTLEEPEAAAAVELERKFKVTDSVIRFLSVRIDLDLKRAEKFRARRELRKKPRVPQARRTGEEKKVETPRIESEP